MWVGFNSGEGVFKRTEWYLEAIKCNLPFPLPSPQLTMRTTMGRSDSICPWNRPTWEDRHTFVAYTSSHTCQASGARGGRDGEREREKKGERGGDRKRKGGSTPPCSLPPPTPNKWLTYSSIGFLRVLKLHHSVASVLAFLLLWHPDVPYAAFISVTINKGTNYQKQS